MELGVADQYIESGQDHDRRALKILLDRIDALCTHALSTLLQHATVLGNDWCVLRLRLITLEVPEGYLQVVGRPWETLSRRWYHYVLESPEQRRIR